MFKLQRLEITGFKSFADYTEILFTNDGITAVVGPNGCGKSNVSDAMTWVLGEQKARNLRGGEMQDVIFAGTKSRQPSGMAEVVLHLIRVDGGEFADFDDLAEIDDSLEELDKNYIDFDENRIAESSVNEFPGSESNGANGNSAVEIIAANNISHFQTKPTAKRRRWKSKRAALDFAPGEAVSVTRRLYRSGESDYLLNGRSCRLRDVQDLFAGTGLSGGHYALIQQEKISLILSAKPADRRGLIEEAAGISKFKTRQRAAETRLESAKNNLRRISDITSEIDKQANSLRRQAARTRRFGELQEDLRELLRLVFAAEERELSIRLRDLRERLTDTATRENQLNEAVKTQAIAAQAATAAARSAEDILASARQLAGENALRRERLNRDLAHQTEQARELENRGNLVRGEIKILAEKFEVVSSDVKRLRDKNQESGSADEVDSAALKNAEADYQQSLTKARQIENSLEQLRGEVLRHTAAVERFREIARQQQFSLERLLERAAGLRLESERAISSHDQRLAEQAAGEAETAAARKSLSVIQKRKQTAAAALANAREAQQAAEKSLGKVRDEANAVRYRRETLEKLDQQNAWLAPAVQKLLAAKKDLGAVVSGTLTDFLRVEARFEKCVEASLGILLHSVIVETQSDALKIAVWLQASRSGSLTVLVGDFQDEPAAAVDSAQCVGDLLGVSAGLRQTLEIALPDNLQMRIIDNLAQAAEFPFENCVTLAGEIVYQNRVFALPPQAGGEKSGILSFKRELRELAARAAELQKDLAARAAEALETGEKTVNCDRAVFDLNAQIAAAERDLMSREVNVKTLRQEIERAVRHKKVVADEINRLNAEQHETEEKHRKAVADAEIAETARIAAQTEVSAISSQLTDAKKIVEKINAAVSEQRAAAAAAVERRRALANAARRVEAEQAELNSRLTNRRQELAAATQRRDSVTASLDQLKAETADFETEKTEESFVIENAAQNLAVARESADAAARELNELNAAAASARDARSTLEVAQAETATTLQNVAARCQQELNLSLTDLPAAEISDEFDLETAKKRVEVSRGRLENFGAVNLLAVEELKEADERLAFLVGQRQDIIEGIAAAEAALNEIKNRSRERFEFAFAEINRNFAELFAEIFGGGRGEMSLLDAADVLESGVEIIAQPPGKRLQNLLLLSGGEKALTAIALVLAIFRFRPAPFCLLDEVDAPLDEANVGRFIEKVAQMSQNIQFIVITHNKRTMEAARALYGITMQEAGISKIVSVKFE